MLTFMWFLWLVLLTAGVSFGGPLGGVAVVALWVVVSYLPGKKAAAREEARYFEDSDEPAELVYVSTTIDFQEMVMESVVSMPGVEDRKEKSVLERKGEGTWRSKLTDASAKKALEDYLSKKGPPSRLTGHEHKRTYRPCKEQPKDTANCGHG